MPVWVLMIVLLGLASPAANAQPKFYPDDPLWAEPITQDVTQAAVYEQDDAYEVIINYFGRPGDPQIGQRAQNVNSVDEVPDGPIFVNRAGRIPLTPELVARAANTDDGPAPGAWSVISGKRSGVTPGFTVRDARGTKWYLKFDPRGWPGMATGSEIIGAKLFWALGYNTTEYHIVHFRSSNLTIAETADITLANGTKRRMRADDLEDLLAVLDRDPDGSYRASASKEIPGKYVGLIHYAGTRNDDPNDIVSHEHHRELRGYFVFAAWLNHVDVKCRQSLATIVTEGGHKFIRTYLLDWGSILGSSGVRPRDYWNGYEQEIEPPLEIAGRAASFGAVVPKWHWLPFYEAPAIGRIPRDESDWDPERWQPLVTNSAFRHARADDKFWAAYKMTFIDEDMIRAVVAEAQFEDPVAAERLVADIMARRERIFATYLAAINPIVEPVLGNDGLLRFRNAAVEFAGAPRPRGYRATWFTFDNATGAIALIGVTEAASTAVPAPELPSTSFLKVELSCVGAPIASWEAPLTVYFRYRAGAWELVGLERMQ